MFSGGGRDKVQCDKEEEVVEDTEIGTHDCVSCLMVFFFFFVIFGVCEAQLSLMDEWQVALPFCQSLQLVPLEL